MLTLWSLLLLVVFTQWSMSSSLPDDITKQFDLKNREENKKTEIFHLEWKIYSGPDCMGEVLDEDKLEGAKAYIVDGKIMTSHNFPGHGDYLDLYENGVCKNVLSGLFSAHHSWKDSWKYLWVVIVVPLLVVLCCVGCCVWCFCMGRQTNKMHHNSYPPPNYGQGYPQTQIQETPQFNPNYAVHAQAKIHPNSYPPPPNYGQGNPQTQMQETPQFNPNYAVDTQVSPQVYANIAQPV